MLSLKIRQYRKKSDEMFKTMLELDEKKNSGTGNSTQIEKELEKLTAEWEFFKENVYAKAIFEHYAPKKPKLIRIKTGETVSWDDAFGNDFESIPKLQRHALIGLVENSSKYRIK